MNPVAPPFQAMIRSSFAPLGVDAPGGRHQKNHRLERSCHVEPGTLDDYGALARFHYRSGRPATIVRILRAVERESGTVAGILTVSMPTIDGAWRRLAWPGRYDPSLLGKREALRRVNAELRTISRVIVEPRFRALGIARALVHVYLGNPLTPATEAVAAMGAVSPFFIRAGMTEYRLPPSRADARLLDALRHVGSSPGALAGEQGARRAAASPFLGRELAAWAAWAKPARAVRGASAETIAPIAAACLLAPPIAYAATQP